MKLFSRVGAHSATTHTYSEADYSVWRCQQSTLLYRVGTLLALLAWLIGGLILHFTLPAQLLTVAWVCLLLMTPIFSIGYGLLHWPRLKAHYLNIVTVLQAAGGVAMVALSWFAAGSVASAAAWCLFTLIWSPLLRLPPKHMAAAALPFLGLLIWAYGQARWQGQINGLDQYTLVAAPLTAFVAALVSCAVIDQLARQNYSNGELIRDQAQSLDECRIALRRYIPSTLAGHIEDGNFSEIGTPRRQRVVILFTDIVGFTDAADRLDPESLTELVNDYMSAMSGIVDQHGGTVSEFVGDGLMAVFGAPTKLPPEEQAVKAIRSAWAMQKALPALNEQWLRLGLGEPLQIRIGVNAGVASVGSFGSEGRMTWTAIGLQANIAARIQSHCQPGSVLITDSVWHLARKQIPGTAKGEVQCRGVHFPVKVYVPSDNAQAA